MPLTQLSKTQWPAYFDRFSKAAAVTGASAETTGLGLSDMEDYVPLLGVSYDAESDALTVSAGGEAHTIAHPRQVHIDHEDEWVHAIEVVDGDGVRHHVVLKEALEVRPV